MLLKRCDQQGLILNDCKVDYRKKKEGTDYDNSQWPERSNIGVIPVIKDGKALRDPQGELILAPAIIDAGSVMPKVDAAGIRYEDRIVPNLKRTDLTFKSEFHKRMGYEYTEIAEQNKDAPTLVEYVSKRAGMQVDITYSEMIGNYKAAIAAMAQVQTPTAPPLPPK